MITVKKDIGTGAKSPATSCQNDKCPWHGTLKVRGRLFEGTVVSTRSLDTVVVTWNYYKYVPKYERYERRKTRVSAHSPKCMQIKLGDVVRIGECRPISKTKKFVVFEKISTPLASVH